MVFTFFDPALYRGGNIGSPFLIRSGGYRMKQKIKCPVCGKWLFSVDTERTKITIYIWCRRCQKERKIDIESL